MNFNRIIKTVKENSPALLSGTAIVGVVTTGYLAAKAGYKTAVRLSEKDPHMSNKDVAKLVWKDYIPAGISGAATIGCVVGNTRVSGKRTAAAQAAFVLSERAYSEYRDRVVEEFGAKKDQAIRDEIAERRVIDNPPANQVVVAGSGEVLCCELMTGRYFASTMEKLRKAQNHLNDQLLRHDRSSLDDFYDLIGLGPTSYSGELGWVSERMMELEFTSIMAENDVPCLAFEYNYTRPLYGGVFG